MMDTIRLWTHQGDDWDLTGKKGLIDHTFSQYAKSHPLYVARIGELARLVGTDQFVWCVDEAGAREYVYSESQPFYEWEIEVERSRILGYIQDGPWYEYVKGAELNLGEIFSKSEPLAKRFSYLVESPLSETELPRYWDLKQGKPPRDWRKRSPIDSR